MRSAAHVPITFQQRRTVHHAQVQRFSVAGRTIAAPAKLSMIQLTDQPIDSAVLVEQARRPSAGAVLLFLGTTREWTGERQTVALDYEAYTEMAQQRLTELETEARQLWPIIECHIVHRTGRVPPAEASVAIIVSTPHRRDAFEAGEWLIDALKKDVPIWKREQWADGKTEWVHPGMKLTKL